MKITIISNNYYPEDSGIGLYSAGMADFLAQHHEVSVIAGTPYYPQWEIYPDYKKAKQFSSEIINEVTVYRFKQYTPKKPTFKGRILQMLHFFLGSVVNVFKIKRCDVVIVVVPFTISVLPGWLLSRICGAKLWIHVQDFEFDAAFETGISSKTGLLHKIIFKVERFLFNRADCISTISKGMLKKLETKTETERFFFPNWIDYSKINPEIAGRPTIYNPSKFNILYSGNIGAKQDWDFFIEFVKECKKNSGIHIHLIGEGAKKEEVVSLVKGFSNLTYSPPVRYEELNDILCGADLHILFQKDTVIDTVMPSKILGMMASARPSIVTGYAESEVKTNFESANGGFYFSGRDTMDNIQKCIAKLSHDRLYAQTIGANARRFIVENYSLEKILSTFQKKIEHMNQ